MAFDFFINYVFAPVILLIGLFGNIMGLIIVGKKKLVKIGPVIIYKCLFVSDNIYLIQIIFTYMPYAFNFDPINLSNIGCKIYNFFSYGLDALSPWCLVYISIEKFISVAYPNKRFIFKKNKNQIIYFILLFLFNILYHLNIPFSMEIFRVDFDNSSSCDFINNNGIIINNMDLVNCVLAPIFLMILFSLLLIIFIFKSRRRVHLNNSDREIERLKRDIKFSISLLSINLLFILLNLPFTIFIVLPYYDDDEIFVTLSYICFLSYAINFYLLLLTNSLFRSEFYSLFLAKQHEKNQTGLEMQTLQNREII
jgi:hypothetical protein